jgi:hypothetical protein
VEIHSHREQKVNLSEKIQSPNSSVCVVIQSEADTEEEL